MVERGLINKKKLIITITFLIHISKQNYKNELFK